jgi:hypothetical protein
MYIYYVIILNAGGYGLLISNPAIKVVYKLMHVQTAPIRRNCSFLIHGRSNEVHKQNTREIDILHEIDQLKSMTNRKGCISFLGKYFSRCVYTVFIFMLMMLLILLGSSSCVMLNLYAIAMKLEGGGFGNWQRNQTIENLGKDDGARFGKLFDTLVQFQQGSPASAEHSATPCRIHGDAHLGKTVGSVYLVLVYV